MKVVGDWPTHRSNVGIMKTVWGIIYFSFSNNLLELITEKGNNYSSLYLKERKCDTSVTSAVKNVENWKLKMLHGIYPSSLLKSKVNKSLVLKWLKKGNLYLETNGFFVAIQDINLL